MRIRHIINPVAVTPASDLYVAQPITFASLVAAKQEADQHGLYVDICFTCYEEDRHIAEPLFRDAGALSRSVLDVARFRKPRKLPLIQDILGKALLGDKVDFIIYTNVDIAVKPEFYVEVTRLIDSGYDAFTINRRTLSKQYTSPAELPLMYRDPGSKHPGHDCFILSLECASRMHLGLGCVGANWIGRILLSNLIAHSKTFNTFETEFLTFHIGDDRAWKKEDFSDYDLHNERELLKTLEYLLPLCDNSRSADLEQMLIFHRNNQNTRSRVQQNRFHRQYQYNKDVSLGSYHKEDGPWQEPLSLNQEPIFVVGYPRSGTTLLQTKLMTQKEIISLPETHFYTIVRSKLRVTDDRVDPQLLKRRAFCSA